MEEKLPAGAPSRAPLDSVQNLLGPQEQQAQQKAQQDQQQEEEVAGGKSRAGKSIFSLKKPTLLAKSLHYRPQTQVCF